MRHQLGTIVLGEVSKSVRGNVFQTPISQSAPHYFEASVPHQVILGQEKIKIDGQEVVFELRGYPPDTLLIQVMIDVPDIFSKEKILSLEEKIFAECFKLLKRRGGNKDFSELYSVFMVSKYDGEPNQFMNNSSAIASLLKSEKMALDQKEIDYTLSAQIKYARNDLSIIDWDGAFLFDPEGNFEPIIELLALANLQLLRHRILDRQLDERLTHAEKLVEIPKKRPHKADDLIEDLRQIIKSRMASIAQFQALERDIKLIGDWYSARLYDLTVKKFKLEEWRKSIKDKLESLEDVYSIIVENFSVSGKQRAEWAQLVGFFILQIGWFVLIILEFFYFTRK